MSENTNKNKIWKLAEMDADHVTAWSNAYVNGNPVSGVDPSGTNEENVVDQEQKNVNRVSTSEKNIQQDDHHSISNEMIKKINEFGWYTGAVCFDLAVAAAEDAASQKYTGAHVGRVKDKKDYAIGGVWKEAPKQPKNYRNLSIRKGVAENMLSYIKASIWTMQEFNKRVA